MIGANGAGKTTLTDALYLAHPGRRFPTRATAASAGSQSAGPYKLIYLAAWRQPLDELARREVRILVELLRAQQ
ncbi:hypothetical protein [Streptomyces sviceus]|uniref:hypothetical protein n=1 Tax=Streptomyces sviceus TaxID=285530 RepID=UPI0036BFA20E